MTLFQTKLCALLNRSEEILKPAIFAKEKWHIESPGQLRTISVIDEARSISIAFAFARDSIKSTPEYAEAQAVYSRDAVFGAATTTAGHWARFDTFLSMAIQHSASFIKDKLVIDYPAAVSFSGDFRDSLGKKLIEFRASARLLGIELTQKNFSLPDGVILKRLTRRELNDRMPSIEPFHSVGTIDPMALATNKGELRANFSVPVDHKLKNAHFTAANDASRLATELFNSILGAVQLVRPGVLRLSHVEVSGGIQGINPGQPFQREFMSPANVRIATADMQKIQSAYHLITGGTGSDKILQRSVHRFLLGRKRHDFSDKLVDYVVAWESLLLTSGGNPIAQEMSYRFALNGASLLTLTQKDLAPRDANTKMKESYAVRSKIVHAGTEKEINKALTAAGFANVAEMCNFLESQYRQAILWLHSIPRKSRPYIKAGGWEELIWPQQ